MFNTAEVFKTLQKQDAAAKPNNMAFYTREQLMNTKFMADSLVSKDGGIGDWIKLATEVSSVIGGVSTVVGGLITLFGGGQNQTAAALQRIGDWIKTVNQTLLDINKSLNVLAAKIDELKLCIDRSFVVDNEHEVRGYCQNYIETLVLYRSDPAQWEPTMKEMYSNLKTSVRKLMDYGHSPVLTVVYAYRTEIDLAVLLVQDPATQQEVVQNTVSIYLQYLAQCINPNLTGSFAAVANLSSVQINDLEAAYTAGDKGRLPGDYAYTECYNEPTDGEHSGSRRVCEGHYWMPNYQINGSIETGFTATLTPGPTLNSLNGVPSRGEGRNTAVDAAQNYLMNTVLAEFNHASEIYKQRVIVADQQHSMVSMLDSLKVPLQNAAAIVVQQPR